MRLTCPNCGAQYEVPDEVIPFDGRDVQCSNCGDTWFQGHPDNPDTVADAMDEAPVPEAEVVEPAPPPEIEPETETETEPETKAETEVEPETEVEADPEPDPEPEPVVDPEPEPSQPETDDTNGPQEPEASEARPDIDAGISSILREEAEREVNLRATESGPLESQADLGLDDVGGATGQRGQGIRSRMARLRGEKPAPVEEARRDLLPDIEEINSAWDNQNDGQGHSNELAQVQAQAQAQEQRGGFLRGFAMIVVIGVVMTLIYAKAPLIADFLPVAEPALNAYVGMVDQGRIWLDAQIGAMVPTPGN